MTSRHQVTMSTNTTIFPPLTPARSHHRTFYNIRSRNSITVREDYDDGDDIEDALSTLIGQTWTISAVSPLFGLDYTDAVKLKQYGKRLRENLASSLSEDRVSYQAKFEPILDLVNHPADPPALKVVVDSKKDEQDKITRIYEGILLTWGERCNEETGDVRLPLLLSRGLLAVSQAVNSTISQMFDCSITTMPASQEDLMWLTTIILNSYDKSQEKTTAFSKRELILEYQIPGLPSSDLIKVRFTLDAIMTLWSNICPTTSNSTDPDEQIDNPIKLDQVKKLFECIRIQMLDNANLELGYCLLTKISLPSFTIKSNKMKVTNVDAMDRVLWFFQDNALHFSPTLTSAVHNQAD